MSRQLIGQTIARLRAERGLTQQRLAATLGISASYLNLIEHDRRAVTASLLFKLTRALDVELDMLSGERERLLMLGVREALSDPALAKDTPPPEELAALGARPALARSVIALHRALRVARDDASGMMLPSGRRIRLPADEARQLYHDRLNHFPELEAAAEQVREQMVGEDGASLAPSEIEQALIWRLRRRHGLVVSIAALDNAMRAYDAASRMLTLSELLPRESRGFQLAFQLMLIEAHRVLDDMVERIEPTSPEADTLIRIGLLNYAAAALLMPYEPFIAAAEDLRYDIALLAARFSVSFEQAAQRLSTLQRPGRRGVPLFFVRLDAASNVTKSFSAGGFPLPQQGGSCPRWIGNLAMTTPGQMRTQVGKFSDGGTYLCFARTVSAPSLGWGDIPPIHSIVMGCEIEHAPHIVYGDGIDPEAAAVRIGPSCRLCDWQNCRSRAFPPLEHRLSLDMHHRTLTRYPFRSGRK
ncbi:hypothetical protein FHR90_001362 [Endobacter medicaginis]|uniref:HTH cro/C1-type domain-containing protein n=2 Tax=Endobacter medicaginis TaxID=1181271 RepID=A0A839V1Y8_9PROT|nr:hypothetical protein [Endobacter medicaginis]MCX5475372.1 short-chain fatty acyl-CoA regulator family protein [Endobacter medicaginis]